MKRLFLFLCIFFFMVNPVISQTRITGANKEIIIKKINTATSSVKSMKCEFVQTKKMKLLKKEMKSQGEMYYVSKNKLRWQYNVPYSYVFILKEGEVVIKSSNNEQRIDVKRNKMFRQISDIVLNSVTGGHLKNTADFSFDIYKNGNVYSARLYPKKKELKKIYEYIEISFNPALSMVNTVTMKEMTGDITIVSLKDVVINKPISEKVFTAD